MQPPWELFKVVSLVENHRQEKDRDYADLLNRMRLGEHTDNDIAKLQTRVRPENHPDVAGMDILVVAATHAVVNHHNDACLSQMASDLVQVEASHSHSIIRNFKPTIHPKKRTVGTTPYLASLPLKIESRVMLIVNLDVSDFLSNGSIGTLKGIVRDKSSGEVVVLMVKFDIPESGQKLQGNHPHLAKSFPGCTPIKKQVHKYSTKDPNSSGGVRMELATVSQFPLVPSFSSTGHKVQGQTVKAPRRVAVHLESIFEGNQAYVMFGRVENLDQLFILGSLPEEKIRCSEVCKDQLDIMKARSENQNPPMWRRRLEDSLKISYLNINSLMAKMDDVKADANLSFADIMLFGETWLDQATDATTDLQLPGYELHLNNAGRGKGLATYYKRDKSKVRRVINHEDLQMTVLTAANTTIIGLYRSRNNSSLLDILPEILPEINTSCVIVGDFNICSNSEPQNPVLQTLKAFGFQEMVREPTHFQGGYIDMLWTRVEGMRTEAELYSPYYTCKDHDSILLSLFSSAPNTESKHKQHFRNYKQLTFLLDVDGETLKSTLPAKHQKLGETSFKPHHWFMII